MKRLSIIVPMYDVEPYVERCIRSLEDQDIPRDDFEIICINDGSPDNCSRIIRALQKEFDNIHLIEQRNQGVSIARNNGIDCACGKYILFVDPDDYVVANSYASIFISADENEAEVTFLGFTVLNKDGMIQNQIFNEIFTGKIYLGIEAYAVSRGDGRTDPDRMWAILYESRFIKKYRLRYLPNVTYLEDGEFISRILCLAERCIFSGQGFYLRTIRPGSATNSKVFYSDEATNGFLLAASNLRKFQQTNNLNQKQKVFLNQPIAKFVLLAVNSSIGQKRWRKFRSTRRALMKSSFKNVETESCNFEYRVCGQAYNISPYLGALALILYPRVIRIGRLFNMKKYFQYNANLKAISNIKQNEQ